MDLASIIGLMKSKNMRWAGHVAVTRNTYRNLNCKLKLREDFEDFDAVSKDNVKIYHNDWNVKIYPTQDRDQ
jgi:hypothetical protein